MLLTVVWQLLRASQQAASKRGLAQRDGRASTATGSPAEAGKVGASAGAEAPAADKLWRLFSSLGATAKSEFLARAQRPPKHPPQPDQRAMAPGVPPQRLVG